MTRFVVFGLLVGLLAVSGLGCGQGPEGPRNDAPIVSSDGVDKKGKKSRTVEAAIIEPSK